MSPAHTHLATVDSLDAPCVGDVVHHVSHTGDAHCRAAIVTRTWGGGVSSLYVLHERSAGWAVRVPQDEDTHEPNTWHWPEQA